MCEAHDISRRLKMNNGSSIEIQMVIAFHSDVRYRRIIYRDASNWTRKLSANSMGHNFWLGCMLEAHDISRCTKKNTGSSREIQIVITFHSDVRFRCIIYLDARNWTRKAMTNSNGHNYGLGCMREAHDISGRSKMNNESNREIQMVITFHSDIQLRHIIYRDVQNSTRKPSANSNVHSFWPGCMLEAHDISTPLKMNNQSSWEIEILITFHSDV